MPRMWPYLRPHALESNVGVLILSSVALHMNIILVNNAGSSHQVFIASDSDLY